MIWQQTPYTSMFSILSFISILLGLYMWRHFRGREATVGLLLILASVEWSLVSLLQLGSFDLATKLFWNKIKYTGMVFLPAAWLIFTFYYTGHEKWETRTTLTLLSSIPVITLGLTFTNEVHNLIWSRTTLDAEGTFSVLHHTYGVWFHINIAYLYALIFLGSFLLIQMIVHYRYLFRWQSVVLLLCALFPPLWSLLYLFNINLYTYLEPTPLSFPITNVIVLFMLLYVRTADIVPVAREIIMDSMGDSVIVLDSKNRIVDMNSSAQHLTKVTSNFVGKSIEDVWPAWSTQVDLPSDWTGMSKEIVLDQEQKQKYHTYDLRVSALTGWRGLPVSRVIVIRDITERKSAEEIIRKSEEKYRLLAENVRDVIWTTDENLHFTYVSPSAMYLWGYSAEEVLNQSLKDGLTPSSFKVVTETLEEEKQDQEDSSQTLELNHTCKDGSTVWTETRITGLHDAEGRLFGFLGVSRDITERKKAENERKKAEEKIKASLEEKEVLLREIHHRVKNNLQIISSLLSLQSRFIKDKEDAEMLKESQDRILSMALIYEKLYLSENLAYINCNEYITDLVNSLYLSYSTARSITVTTEVEDVRLPIDTAIPCGLIINELVSNCLKHAFPGMGKGEVRVSLRSINGSIELIVADNGVGIPEDFDFENTESLGLHLVTILVEGQLSGKITLSRKEGTEFCITFGETQ